MMIVMIVIRFFVLLIGESGILVNRLTFN